MIKELLVCVVAVVATLEAAVVYRVAQPYNALQAQPVVYQPAVRPVIQLVRVANSEVNDDDTENPTPAPKAQAPRPQPTPRRPRTWKETRDLLEDENSDLTLKQKEVERKLKEVQRRLEAKKREEERKAEDERQSEIDQIEEDLKAQQKRLDELKKKKPGSLKAANLAVQLPKQGNLPIQGSGGNQGNTGVQGNLGFGGNQGGVSANQGNQGNQGARGAAQSPADPYDACASDFTADERDQIRDKHNALRSKIASGQFYIDDKGQRYSWPQAADMLELSYDCTLENEAHNLAKKYNETADIPSPLQVAANFQPFKADKNGLAGLGVAAYGQWKRGFSVALRGSDFIALYLTTNDEYQLHTRFAAQMIDAKVTKIGCAVRPYKEKVKKGSKRTSAQDFNIVVCRYDHLIETGEPFYTAGEACSACPDGTKCHVTTKLCAHLE